MAQGVYTSRKESAEKAALRWEALRRAQQLHSDPVEFAHYVMDMLGFSMDDLMEDIVRFITCSTDPSIMVKAQRGQAKSTLAAIGVVFDLMHHPHHRDGVIMAQAGLATDIITYVIRIIEALPELHCMLPDKKAGDRTGIQGYDIHHSLKGPDKSPSLAPISLMSNLQGRRLDLAILDDLESEKNSATAEARASILKKAVDLYAICEWRIVWLGTPQSLDSIYFQLPAMGTKVRVWPGRYPTVEEEAFYGDTLAPFIKEKMEADPSLRTGGGLDGSRGQVTSPMLRDETFHQQREALGKDWYELQYMLNATLSDANRKALNTKDIIVVQDSPTFPVTINPGIGPGFQYKHLAGGKFWDMTLPSGGSEARKAPIIRAYVDPAAGGNTSRDRTAFSVVGLVGGNLVILKYGTVKGGYDVSLMRELAEHLAEYKPVQVMIEKNMGHGAFTQVFQPVLKEVAALHNWNPGLTEELVRTQKEVRIIDTLGPIMGRKSLWVTEKALREEGKYLTGLQAGEATSHNLWVQLGNITRTKGCLAHDDQLDSLSGACNMFLNELAIDSNKVANSITLRYLEQLEIDKLGIPKDEAIIQRKQRWQR